MKLSTAILKGCKIAPIQARDSFFNDGTNAACVLGAALLGSVGIKRALNVEMDPWHELRKKFPRLKCKGIESLPVPSFYTIQLDHQLARLNDTEGWTREQIAAALKENGI